MKRVYNYKPDKEDKRDLLFSHPAKTIALPESFDLENKFSPVVNQGGIGSCTANAIASGLREYLLISDGLPLTRLSRSDLYWQERKIEGTLPEDSGAYIRDGLKALHQRGVAPEVDFPYDESTYNNEPSPQCDLHAGKFKITTYKRILGGFDQMIQAIFAGHPVVIGMSVFESFESENASRTGIIPMPDLQTEVSVGGHAMAAGGWKPINGIRHAKVRNSWGPEWGDHGYCWIPEPYFNNRQWVFDMWTATVDPLFNSIPIDKAVDILESKGILESPEFWRNLIKNKPTGSQPWTNISILVRRIAAHVQDMTRVGVPVLYNAMSYDQSVNILASKFIINEPATWISFGKANKYDNESQYAMILSRKAAAYIQAS